MAIYKINESKKKVTESYSDGMLSIDQLREAISNLEELVSEMEVNNVSSIKASPNTYGLGNFFLGTSSGYINLNDIYRYIPDSEDEYEDEEYESLKEGNPVSNKLPGSLDSFLQDIAQVHGLISYNDIMKFNPDENQIKELKRLRAKYNREAQYNDEESEKTLASISKEVANIVKNESLTEATDSKDYKVFSLAMDVAAPADKSLREFGVGSTDPRNPLYNALQKALESVGLEMAGDYIDSVGEVTQVYKDNEYEFSFND